MVRGKDSRCQGESSDVGDSRGLGRRRARRVSAGTRSSMKNLRNVLRAVCLRMAWTGPLRDIVPPRR